MYTHNLNPILIDFGFVAIRWYSLAYIFGILAGWVLAKRFFIINQDIKTKFDDYVTYLIFGIIIGGRLGYVLFYNLDYYFENPIDIFKIWQGGMSFHGGVIGIIIISVWFANKNKQNVFSYLDIISLVAPIGIFFGRLSNFINSELYGKVTDLPWSVIFIQIDNLPRHPTQIYEAILEGIILFFILMNFKNKNFLFKPGLISSLFLIFYSIFRFSIEFLRVPDAQLGYLLFNLTMGQILSVILMLTGLVLFYFKNENKQIN